MTFFLGDKELAMMLAGGIWQILQTRIHYPNIEQKVVLRSNREERMSDQDM